MECEVKILEIDSKEISDVLLHLGAQKVFDGPIETIYYDYANKQIRSNHEVFRLRRLGEIYILTFKKQISKNQANMREEIEVAVDSMENMEKIIAALGLREWDRLAKHRTSFQWNDMHVDIDTYPEVPTFMEIEAENEDKLREYVGMLGFRIEDTKNWGFEELFAHYGIKR